MPRRVVVTGIGVVSPLGVGKETFAPALFGGATGIDAITGFDTRRFPSKSAAQVRDFKPRDYIAPATLRRMDRLSQMGTASACMAMADAGIEVNAGNRERMGIILGTCFGATDVAAQFGKVIFSDSPRHANPILVPNTVMNAPAGHAAVELGVRGVNATVNHREVSSEGALVYGADTIARGRADVILAGGGDVISEFCFEVLSRFHLLSPLDGGNEGARPFDQARNGTVVGEGVGVLCLEALDHARARQAPIYCEIAGWGLSGAPTAPISWPTDSRGPVLALTRALAAAGLEAETIDAIFASANGGRDLDQLEADALGRVFSSPRCQPLVTSLKGALGEGFASGGMGAVAMALAIKEGKLPPVLGLAQPLAELNFVRTHLQGLSIRHAVLNGLASGGTFAAVVFKPADLPPHLEKNHERR